MTDQCFWRNIPTLKCLGTLKNNNPKNIMFLEVHTVKHWQSVSTSPGTLNIVLSFSYAAVPLKTVPLFNANTSTHHAFSKCMDRNVNLSEDKKRTVLTAQCHNISFITSGVLLYIKSKLRSTFWLDKMWITTIQQQTHASPPPPPHPLPFNNKKTYTSTPTNQLLTDTLWKDMSKTTKTSMCVCVCVCCVCVCVLCVCVCAVSYTHLTLPTMAVVYI